MVEADSITGGSSVDNDDTGRGTVKQFDNRSERADEEGFHDNTDDSDVNLPQPCDWELTSAHGTMTGQTCGLTI